MLRRLNRGENLTQEELQEIADNFILSVHAKEKIIERHPNINIKELILNPVVAYLVENVKILDAYCYNDDRATNYIKYFKTYVENLGLKFSNCYHSSGIGNNNDYMIFLETIPRRVNDMIIIIKNGTYIACINSL